MSFFKGKATTLSSSDASNMVKRSSSSSNRDKDIAQYSADAGLLAEYEQSGVSGKLFDYSRSVLSAPLSVPGEQITDYLSRIQRGGHVQPFGCMLAVDEPTLKIIAFSENSFEMLGLNDDSETNRLKGLIGIDVRTLFTQSSSASLARAAVAREMSLLNPVWVYTRTTQKPFYAILHRIDVGVVIDLEPARSGDPALSLAGAVQSQKLAVRAISRLQSLPGGDIRVLCDTLVEDVWKLTGYDRVMVYKFHDDDHGEVVSEIRKDSLEPYLGLHYPSTDIPQAARFLFKQNRVRIICDCHAKPVDIIQSEELKQHLCLVNSTLRAPHDCHAQYMTNMGSISSLVMAVVVNSGDSTRLWGLVVCHHTSPRYVPFPLRYACEFLMQAFALQLYMELQLASQLAEKKILRTQTLLCDMLLRDAPFGIVTQSPSIMDLVKCDGAAMYYGGKCWLLGITPTERQVKDIARWLLTHHGDTSGLSTDSLADAGYPDAGLLGDAVCGLASAKITPRDFLFWFRSHTAKEVKWGGAKHSPESKDETGKMHPRSSFKAFLEVVKNRSLPWEVSEINAIHSLQIIMRDSFQEMDVEDPKSFNTSQQSDTVMQEKNEIGLVACEMVRLIETATAPIFGVDSAGHINGWNAKISELTGLHANEAMGRSLIDDIALEDSRGAIGNLLNRALQGEEDKNVEFKLKNFKLHPITSVVYLLVNACTSRDYKNNVVGVCFVGQDITLEKEFKDKFARLEGDYKAITKSLNPLIPPIFVSDGNACCSEWNAVMEKLTGWMRHEVISKTLPGEIFGGFCKLKGQDALTKFMIILYRGISGQDTEKSEFGFFNREGSFVEVLLTANKRKDAVGNVIGCLCFLQTLPQQQQALEQVALKDQKCFSKLELAYIRQEVISPLNGIRFIHKLLEKTANTDEQRQLLESCDACERQIMMIIKDIDLENILEGGSVELEMNEFLLGNVLDAVVSQAMIVLRKKNIQLLHEIPDDLKVIFLCGDQIRLQLVLSKFLLIMVQHTPSPGGWVEIKISTDLKILHDGNEFIRLQFRITHPGEGMPSNLAQEMSDGGILLTSPEGLGLNLSHKLLTKMNGSVRYVRDKDKCYFLIDLVLKLKI